MTVPPDILALLISAVVFIAVLYFVVWQIEKHKPKPKIKRYPTPKVHVHKPQKNQEE